MLHCIRDPFHGVGCGKRVTDFRVVAAAIVLGFSAGSVPLAAQDCAAGSYFFPGVELGKIRAARMSEVCGLTASRRNAGMLWVHNNVNSDKVYGIDLKARAVATFGLSFKLTDPQDIAAGPGPVAGASYLYIGDIGDSSRSRPSIRVVRVAEPAVDLTDSNAPNEAFTEVTQLLFVYPDGPRDARALFIDPVDGDLYVVTCESPVGRVYRAARVQLTGQATVTLSFVTPVTLAQVTAADISANGTRIVARSRTNSLMWERRDGESIAAALARPPWSLPLAMSETTGESLTLEPSGEGYYTVGKGEDQPVYFFRRNRSGFSAGLALGTVSDSRLTELSGLVASRQTPGVVWTHNDGAQRRIYALGTNGVVRGVFTFARTTADFEDIAIGPGPVAGESYIYAGDIGDNNSSRDQVQVLRAIEPRVFPGSAVVNLADETPITLVYPDGPHDAEALMVDPLTGDLFIVTKEAGWAGVYRASRTELNSDAPITLAWAGEVPFELVSAADISADGKSIALRREDVAWLWPRSPGQTVPEALQGTGQEVPVIGTPLEPNGEAITFDSWAGGYLTISEGSSPVIYQFAASPVPAFAALPRRVGESWQLAIRGCAGALITVESSVDLLAWQSLGEVQLGSGATPFTDPAVNTRRYYRLRTLEP